jgi:hypothetical protein
MVDVIGNAGVPDCGKKARESGKTACFTTQIESRGLLISDTVTKV